MRDEQGYVALLVCLLLPTVFLGLSAIGVDLARILVEGQRLQKAADAAAMAGVTYMPADLAKARTAAVAVAAKNGYPEAAPTTIMVEEGARPSQLRVTITTTIHNTFGSAIGISTARITRTAVADYTAPAPMGSPCNTFGNEPPSQPVVTGQPVAPPAQPADTALPTPPFSNCTSLPQFWAAIEGPATDKVQGDRYMTSPCASSNTYRCSASKNEETQPEGYFFAVHVEPTAIGTPIDVQIYDPAFVYTTISCSSLPSSGLAANMNDYTTTDGVNRYGRYKNTSNPPAVLNSNAAKYCSGDYNPGPGTPPANPPVTSFAMRQQTDTGDPMRGDVISGCTKQFRGTSTVPTTSSLKKFSSGTTNSTTYNRELARVFHQWVSLCTFTPARSGDYYLQVRTNVSLGGMEQTNVNARGQTMTSIVYSGNAAVGAESGNLTTGNGLNSFALRAVPTDASKRDDVAVAGFSRMPILQNANVGKAEFNLIRALPGTRGQYIGFSFYDAADGAEDGGSVKVIAPTDATGSLKTAATIPGCKGAMNDATEGYTDLTGCEVEVEPDTHNGNVQHMVIPLPTDYNCDPSTLGGCWFRVEINFTGSTAITDFTTWDANIGGDPVRLIE